MRNAVIMILLLLPPALMRAQTTAADTYRIAAAQLPVGRDEAERSALAHPLDALLDQAAGDLLERGGKALALFDSASEMAFGDWGFDPADPLYGGRTYKGLADLADFVSLRARQSAARSNLDSAIADCGRIALLSRRLSIQPSLTRQIQQNLLMEKAVDLSGSILLELSPQQIEQLVSSLRSLPRAADPLAVVQIEQESYLWLYGRLIANDDIRIMTARSVGTINSMFGIQLPPIDVGALARDPQLAEKVLAETRDVFSKMTDALKEPPGERSAAIDVISTHYDFSHALSRGAAQLIVQIHHQSERHSRMMEMLFTAAAICSDPARPIDPQRAKTAAATFDFRATPDGFELSSKPAPDDPPILLKVGRAAFPTTQPTLPK